jgi:DNA-directed RNA polymerase subunit K/omega
MKIAKMDYFEIQVKESPIEKKKRPKSSIDDKLTDAVLTPYEYARLLSCRSKQIANGYPLEVKWDEPFDPIKIAKYEIEQRVVPLYIERKLPDGRIEVWSLKDMDIRDY